MVVDRDLLKDTHRSRQTRQRTCFSFFMPQNPSINHLNFYCIKQIDYIFPCVCNRSQMTSQRVKNNSHATRLRLVLRLVFFTRYDVICDLLQYTHARKNVIHTCYSAPPCVSTRHFFLLKRSHSCFYSSTETQKQCPIRKPLTRKFGKFITRIT